VIARGSRGGSYQS
jgi:hypothetical protein